MDLVTIGIVVAFFLFVVLMKELAQYQDGAIIFWLVLLLILVFGIAVKIGITHAEHKMYEKIRDDVNITEHKLYKKWLIDNPKESK